MIRDWSSRLLQGRLCPEQIPAPEERNGAGHGPAARDLTPGSIPGTVLGKSMQTNCRRLSPGRAGLLIVDMQERLLPVISGKERVLQNALILLKSAPVLGVPVFVTEQYPKGLGPTVPEVAQAVDKFAPFQKLAFSACGAPGMGAALKDASVSDVILCGVETHVCVTQTCLDLLDSAFGVFVVADATSSRTPENQRYGLDRMRDAGAAIVSAEMVVFELLQQAGTEKFKQVLSIVK